jgi:hypothetical protein
MFALPFWVVFDLVCKLQKLVVGSITMLSVCVLKYSGCCDCSVEEHPYCLGSFLGWFGCSLIFFSSCVIRIVAVSLMEIDGGACWLKKTI